MTVLYTGQPWSPGPRRARYNNRIAGLERQEEPQEAFILDCIAYLSSSDFWEVISSDDRLTMVLGCGHLGLAVPSDYIGT